MLVDLEHAKGVEAAAVEYDVCVVGAGTSGHILTHKLAESGLRVCVLEAGGLTLEERSQRLYKLIVDGQEHLGYQKGRFRTLGGTSTRWGGQLLPYTHDIFTAPQGTPSPSWPFDEHEVEQYYADVQQLLGVDALPFDDSVLPELGRPKLKVKDEFVLRCSKWIPFNKRNQAATVGKALRVHPQVTFVLHANMAGLEGDGERITAARVVDYEGNEYRFRARRFVLATSTIESSRLMLLSPGVPNRNGLVGKGFHDHVFLPVGEYHGEARKKFLKVLGPAMVAGTLHTFKLEASPELRECEGLMAVMANVTTEEPEDSGAAAVRHALQALQRGHFFSGLKKNLLPLLTGVGDVARLLFEANFRGRRYVSPRAAVVLRIDTEQIPHEGMYVSLSDEVDALGMRKAVLHWSSNQLEREHALRFLPYVKQEMERLGVAPDVWYSDVQNRTITMDDTLHAMGGLVMGTDPATSVVDTNLKVHELENLYVLSCAVYPAGGSSNPTFTLLNLAFRLAKHLAG